MSVRIFVVICVLVAGMFLLASKAGGVVQMTDPKHGLLFIWTADEMDKLEAALQELVAERDALRRRVAEYRKSCT